MTNKSLTATEAKNRFGDLVELARAEPVTIMRNDRPVAVVLSPSEYARLTANDDAYWGEQAEVLSKRDFMSAKDSQAFINDILNAPDSAI
jgi:prevent-host-death family protein